MSFSFDEATAFDKNNSEHFRNNIWSKKYGLGLYFSALIDEGVELDIPIGVDTGKGLKWYKTPHALHDGFSAICKLFEELDIEYKVPKFNLKKIPLSLKMLKLALKALSGQEHKFYKQSSYSSDQSFEYFYVKGVSQNIASYIKKASDYLIENELENTNLKWMVPVRTNNEKGLSASYIALNYNKGQDLSSIKNTMVSKLKAGEYFGVEKISKLGLFFGKNTIKKQTEKILKLNHPGWAGSISSLKNIGSVKEVKELIVLAPVRWHRPIGIALYEFNNEAYMTVAVHKSLKEFDILEFKKALCQ